MNTVQAQSIKLLQGESLKSSESIKTLTTRKGTLENNLSKVNVAIGEREQAISTAMIAGDDYAELITLQQHDKTEADGLRLAIAQVVTQLISLGEDVSYKRKQIAGIEKIRANEEADEALLIVIQKLRDILPYFEDAKQKMLVVQSGGQEFTLSHSDVESIALTDRVFLHVLQWFKPGTAESLVHQLQELEKAYPLKLAAMRAKNPDIK